MFLHADNPESHLYRVVHKKTKQCLNNVIAIDTDESWIKIRPRDEKGNYFLDLEALIKTTEFELIKKEEKNV